MEREIFRFAGNFPAWGAYDYVQTTLHSTATGSEIAAGPTPGTCNPRAGFFMLTGMFSFSRAER